MVILDNYNFILLFNYYIQNTDLISRSVFFYILIELLFVVHCHFLSHFHPNPLIYYPLVLFLSSFLSCLIFCCVLTLCFCCACFAFWSEQDLNKKLMQLNKTSNPIAMIKNSFFCFLSIKYLLSYFEMIQNGPPASAPLLASLYTILKSHALFLALLPQSATRIFPSLVIPLSTI